MSPFFVDRYWYSRDSILTFICGENQVENKSADDSKVLNEGTLLTIVIMKGGSQPATRPAHVEQKCPKLFIVRFPVRGANVTKLPFWSRVRKVIYLAA